MAPDGRTVVVANHLPLVPATAPVVAARLSILDTQSLQTCTVELSDGSTSLKDVCLTPDGRYALVTHVLANFDLVASHVDQGWMNTNSLSVVDLVERRLVGNLLLDDLYHGEANPWGIALTGDGATICVAHAGTHELSVIETRAVMAHVRLGWTSRGPLGGVSAVTDCRRRLALPGNGPRAIVVRGSRVYCAEYFSDTVAVVDLAPQAIAAPPSTISLGPAPPASCVRRGEMLFHDASFCYERWQSCASCHPDARADGMNWDLLNDGVGNPKNTKSMLLAHRTPPAMISGVRASAEVAVRTGLKHILFAEPREDVAAPIDAYLKSLRPVPSPRLVDGRLAQPPSGDNGCSPAGRSAAPDATRHRSIPTFRPTRSARRGSTSTAVTIPRRWWKPGGPHLTCTTASIQP